MPTFADGESGALVRTKINNAITTVDGLDTGDNLLMDAAERSKLSGIENNATADQTGAEIKSAYEAELDTNAFTDTEKTKLSNIEDDADVTDETNVVASLSGATLTDAGTPAGVDKVLIQDTSDSNNLKYVDVSEISATGITNIVDDTTPQLGVDLDVNGQEIVSVSNGNIVLNPNGTGNVLLGNYSFDADQSVGAPEDNYILKYDNTSGTISLEAETVGGLSDGDYTDITVSGSGTVMSLKDNTVAMAEIADSIKTGSDINLVTGTAGTTDQLAKWNVDGDLVAATDVDLGDPAADKGVGWDDSAGSAAYWDPGNGLSFDASFDLNAEVSLAGTETLTNKTLTAPIIDAGVTTDSTTARTLALTDASDVLLMSSGSANTVTIPTNASVAFATGTMLTIVSTGTGTTTIAGDTGVTLQGNGGSASAGSCDIQTQYGAAALIKIGTDTWIVSGDIDAVA